MEVIFWGTMQPFLEANISRSRNYIKYLDKKLSELSIVFCNVPLFYDVSCNLLRIEK